MKKIFSTGYNEPSLNAGLFILRVLIGVLIAIYGYQKFTHFSEMAGSDFWEKQVNFLGMGGKVSLGLTVFAELFCSILLIAGLVTRLALIPLIICMGFIFITMSHYEIIQTDKNGSHLNDVFFYLMIYVALLLTGPGKWSLDYLIGKK
ncbi:MAG: DoxX family protein [Chitinophagaceae bacterium]